MDRINELKSNLELNIELHRQLSEAIRRECECIENDDIMSLPMLNSTKRRIEAKINMTNRTIMTLFENYYQYAVSIDPGDKRIIEDLVEQLRGSIRGAVEEVGTTISSIRHAQKDVVGKLKEMDRNKSAIRAYARS